MEADHTHTSLGQIRDNVVLGEGNRPAHGRRPKRQTEEEAVRIEIEGATDFKGAAGQSIRLGGEAFEGAAGSRTKRDPEALNVFSHKHSQGGAPQWRRPKDHFEKANDDGYYSMYENRLLHNARIPTNFINNFEGDLSMGEIIRTKRGKFAAR